MTTDPHNDCKVLAARVASALGVSGAPETAERIMEHTIARECIHLHQVEQILEPHDGNKEISDALELVAAVRERLALAGECAHVLENLLKPKAGAS